MKEKHMQTFFSNYIKNNPPKQTEVYELKICKLKSLPFDAVKEHQIKHLLEAEQGFLYHKITDQPIFRGMKTKFTSPKPFDCFCIKKAKSYVVIWFYVPRTPKIFYYLNIVKFLELKENCGRKSLTREMVEKNAVHAIHI